MYEIRLDRGSRSHPIFWRDWDLELTKYGDLGSYCKVWGCNKHVSGVVPPCRFILNFWPLRIWKFDRWKFEFSKLNLLHGIRHRWWRHFFYASYVRSRFPRWWLLVSVPSNCRLHKSFRHRRFPGFWFTGSLTYIGTIVHIRIYPIQWLNNNHMVVWDRQYLYVDVRPCTITFY